MSKCQDIVVVNKKSQLPMVIEENSLYTYLEKIKQFPVLTEDEEKQLIYDFQTKGDLASAQKLIQTLCEVFEKISSVENCLRCTSESRSVT